MKIPRKPTRALGARIAAGQEWLRGQQQIRVQALAEEMRKRAAARPKLAPPLAPIELAATGLLAEPVKRRIRRRRPAPPPPAPPPWNGEPGAASLMHVLDAPVALKLKRKALP
jgi:hypothetical protein